MPEEEGEQEIENLFEKIMQKNSPNLSKEMDMQVQEAQRVPKKLDPRKHTPRQIIITLPRMKYKERILKAARGHLQSYLQRSSLRLSAGFSKETLQTRRGWKEVFQSHERQGPTSQITLSSKAIV